MVKRVLLESMMAWAIFGLDSAHAITAGHCDIFGWMVVRLKSGPMSIGGLLRLR